MSYVSRIQEVVKAGIHPAWGLAASILVLPFLISSNSLWLDETYTALYAMQPDWFAFVHRLRNEPSSDAQMPLSFLFAWLNGQVASPTEWQLRAINLLWSAVALLGLYRAGRALRLPWLPCLLVIQPYFWYFTNEARPYALQLACGAWMFAGFADFFAQEGRGEAWSWKFSVAALCLFLATMLAPLPIAAAIASAGLIAWWHGWNISRRSITILLGAALACIPIAIYYLSTLMRGVKSAQVWHVDLKFFGYVVYELSGMTGLGLPTEEIRALAKSGDFHAMLATYFPDFFLPAFCALLLLVVLILGLHHVATSPRGPVAIGIVGVIGVTSLVFVVTGISIQKAFWARHFAPVFCYYVGLLGIAIARVNGRFGVKGQVAIGALLVLLLLSSLSLRFSPRYGKQDYRAAAEIAHQAIAEKKSVWWVATDVSAQYYRLDVAHSVPETGKALIPHQTDLKGLPAPDLIIVSIRDTNDLVESVMEYVKQYDYHADDSLRSFIIWRR